MAGATKGLGECSYENFQSLDFFLWCIFGNVREEVVLITGDGWGTVHLRQ